MVAITVILAAVIGTFVLGLGGNVNSTPQAQFSFQNTEGDGGGTDVVITHDGGDAIEAGNMNIVSASLDADWETDTDFAAGDDVIAGDSIQVGDTDGSGVDIGASGTDLAGETVRIIYESPNSDNTATLARYEVDT
jgi:FlaG/FlaF family flagellin (archaellin)